MMSYRAVVRVKFVLGGTRESVLTMYVVHYVYYIASYIVLLLSANCARRKQSREYVLTTYTVHYAYHVLCYIVL